MSKLLTAKSNRPPRLRRWTREEYYRLVEQNFFYGQRIELIGGKIIQMAPQHNAHSVAIELVNEFARRAFPADHWVRIQMPLHLPPNSEPEPDIAVVRGSPREATDHPTSAILVVEVSDTSLRYDRRKARLYAKHGLADYWILNIQDRQLELYRDPVPGGGRKGSPPYENIRVLHEFDTITPLAVPNASVRVTDLLPSAR
jgi:Uma2 family endonuclease